MEARKRPPSVFNAGYLAFEVGEDPESNPYPLLSVRYHWWKDGWEARRKKQLNLESRIPLPFRRKH